MTERFNKFSILEISPGPHLGTVRIRGVEANMYLTMNEKGNLYGSRNSTDPGTIFIEETAGDSVTYLSSK